MVKRLLFIVVGLSASLLHAATLRVGQEGHSTIAGALGDAEPGDTVFVAAGAWSVPEGVTISKDGVVLRGAGAEQTRLDGEEKAYAVVKVNAQGVVVTGFTIAGGSSHGVYLNEENGAHVHHNVITENGDRGILLGMGKPYAKIDHNTFYDNKVSAIYTYRDEPKTAITNNVMVGNSRSIVVDADSNRMTVKYNCFWNQSNDSAWVKKHKTNMKVDPKFVNAGSDFRLAEGSPCLGKGESGSNVGALGKTDGKSLPAPQTGENLGRYMVAVFTSDTETGESLLEELRAAGFTNDESYVEHWTIDNGRIAYGAASKEALRRVGAAVRMVYGIELEESEMFDEDDFDIYVEIP